MLTSTDHYTEVRRWIRSRQKAHRLDTAPSLERLGDRWSPVVSAIVLCAIFAGSLRSIFRTAHRSPPIVDAATAHGIFIALTCLGAMFAAKCFGPLYVPVADRSWLLPLPLPRAQILSFHLRRTAVVGLLAAALNGALGWFIYAESAVAIPGGCLNVAAIVALLGLCTLEQCRLIRVRVYWAFVAMTVGVGACGYVFALRIGTGHGSLILTSVVAAVVLIAAVGFALTARSQISRTTDVAISAQANRADSIVVAFSWLRFADLALLRSDTRSRGAVGPFRPRLFGTGSLALSGWTIRYVVRSCAGRRWALGIGCAVGFLLALPSPFTVWSTFICLYVAVTPFADPVRFLGQVGDTMFLGAASGRSRVLPSLLIAAICVIGTVILALTDPAESRSFSYLGVCLGVVYAVLRRALSAQAESSGLVDSPIGLVDPSALQNLSRGFIGAGVLIYLLSSIS